MVLRKLSSTSTRALASRISSRRRRTCHFGSHHHSAAASSSVPVPSNLTQGRMRPSGLAQIAAAKADGRWNSAYAPASTAEAPPDLVAALAANPKAAGFFATLTGANRYAILYRIGAVKKAETRAHKI